MNIRPAVVSCCLICTIALPAQTLASGFHRMESASSYLGTSGAGQATDRTASAAFNNPAGLAGLEKPEFYGAAIVVNDSMTFYDDGSEGISPGYEDLRRNGVDYGIGWSGGPALYYAHPLSERTAIGFSLNSPFGGESDFGEDWVGSHFAEEAGLSSVQASVALGYQISEQWSVGAALGAQYLNWWLNVDLPPAPYGPVNPGLPPEHPAYPQLLPPGSEEDVDIDDIQPFWMLGVQWEFNPGSLVGFRYVPESTFDLEGKADILAPIPDMTVVQSFDAIMELSTPRVATLSLSVPLDERWRLLADIEHFGWSAWRENRIVHEGAHEVVIDRDWKDAMGYSLGFEFDATEKTKVRFGAGYDESPIDDDKLKIDPPMDRQVTLSAGFESRLSERTSLVGAYQYLDMGDVRVDQDLFPGQVIRGHSDAHVHLFHFGLRFGF